MFLTVLSCCWRFHAFKPFMDKKASQKAVLKVKLSYRETKHGKSEQIFWTLDCAFHTQTQGHVLCMSKTCMKMNYSMLMVVYTLCLCVCVNQMGKRRFSGLEVTLMVLFSLVLVVAVALIVVLATGEPGVIGEGRWWDGSIIPLNDNILYTNAETQTRIWTIHGLKKKSPYVQLIVILWQNNQYGFPRYMFNISFNIVGMTCVRFNRDIRHKLLPKKSTVYWGQTYCPVGLQLLKISLLTTKKNCTCLVKDSEKCESLMFH